MATVNADQLTPFLAHSNDAGKTQLLSDHLISVSIAARRMASAIGLEQAGAAIGLLHDLGKYSADFQTYLGQMGPDVDTEEPQFARGSIDHSTAGAQAIWRRLKKMGDMEGAVGEILAICIASHHSGLIDRINPDGFDALSKRLEKADELSHHDEACRNAEPLIVARIDECLNDVGLVNSVRGAIADIYQKEKNRVIFPFKLGLLVRLLFSCLIDADRSDTADCANPAVASLRQHGCYVEWTTLIDRLEAALLKFPSKNPVDQVRHQISQHCEKASSRPKGIFTLTVPTGGGKTLASLRFALNHAAAWNMDRVIYVSPYISIVDQNADVARKILEIGKSEHASVVLEHHSNLAPLKETQRSKILSENWDAPVVFTTAVQVLQALFGRGTRSVRPAHQMCNSILIFDEIQTLPVRCVHLFNNALNFLVQHCGSTVVLCTATQPLLHTVDAAKGAILLDKNAELMPDVDMLFAKLRRCDVLDRRKNGGWAHSETADLAVLEMESSGNCLVIVNTKEEAISIFKLCKANAAEPLVFHLSTSMCPAHRMKILDEVKSCLKRETPLICISTQLIEAGVDIDFSAVIRALAGLDSIAQAAGRCNRHGTRKVGRVHIVNLTGELSMHLRDIRLGQEAAERVLDEYAVPGETRMIDLTDPRIVEQYFRYYFFDRRKEMDYPVDAKKIGREDTLLNMLGQNTMAANACKNPQSTLLKQSFMSAAEAFEPIDSGTQGVIVPYLEGGRTIIAELTSAHGSLMQFALLKRAQIFTVNVFPHIMKRLKNQSAVHEAIPATGILVLNEKYYSADFGLSIEGAEEMEFANA